MTFEQCILDGVANNQISAKQGEYARSLFAKKEAAYKKKMAGVDATKLAGQEAFDQLKYEAAQTKKRHAANLQAKANIVRDAKLYKGKFQSGMMASLLEKDGSGQSPFLSVTDIRESVRGLALSKMDNVLASFKRTAILGRIPAEQKAAEKNLLDELMGKASGDQSAKALADAWKDASEWLRKQFNNAGGTIPKLVNWGLPQSHDRIKVRNAGSDEWVKYIKDKLDWENMTDGKTGKKIAEEDQGEILLGIYESIKTDGLSKIDETGTRVGKSLARSREDHRFLKFKSAEDWLAYQDKFGGGDVYSIMMGYVDGMARDIAIMRRFGANPNATIRWMKTQQDKLAKQSGAKAESRFSKDWYQFENMYGMLSGSTIAPVNEKLHWIVSGVSDLLTAAQLGSTFWVAMLGDTGTARMAARIAGMPHSKLLVKMLKNMAASKMTKQQAIRAGLVIDSWVATASQQARFVGDFASPIATRWVSDRVMTASALTPWTQSGRMTYGLEYMGHLTDLRKTAFDKLPRETSLKFKEYGITKEDWDGIRNTPVHEPKGLHIIRPTDIANEDLSFKYLAMINQEVNYAIPVASLRARSALQFGIRPGTVGGALIRSVSMYKSFPVTFYLNNIRQISHLDKTKLKKFGYATELLVTTTMLGALALQISEMAKGRDPIEMFSEDGTHNAKFWGAALIKGGGLGLWGDFLFGTTNQYGHGLAEAVAGPGIQLYGDILNLTVGNVQKALTGKETNVPRDMINFVGRTFPGNSLWYARTAMERLGDQMRYYVDPDASQRIRRLERKRKKEYNQGYWWRRGELTPRRPPDLREIAKSL